MPLDTSQKARIHTLIAQIAEIDPAQLRADAHFTEDYGVDSLRAIEIMAELEKTFGLTLDPALLAELTSLERIYDILDPLVEPGAAMSCDATVS